MEKTDDSSQKFNIFERGEFSLMVIRGDIQDSHLPNLLKTLEGLLEKNTHLLVNFLLTQSITETLFEVLITIKYLLADHKNLLSLVYLPEKMKKELPIEFKKSLDFNIAAHDSIEMFKEKSYFPPLNLLKTVVSRSLSTLLFKYQLPLIRKKIFIKEINKSSDVKESFMGDLTSGHILKNDKSFFHIGFSYSNKILDQIQSVSEIGKIFNGITFGEEIITDSLEQFTNLDFKLEKNSNEKLYTKKLPPKEFNFLGEDFLLFDSGVTVVLPLSSYYGDIFLEIWIPKKFERKILESINS
jgi:hypothetical protein